MENKGKCEHFTELGEEFEFVDKDEVYIKCGNCGKVLRYVRGKDKPI